MFEAVHEHRKRHEELAKFLLEQSFYTAAVVAIAILIVLSLSLAIPFIEK